MSFSEKIFREYDIRGVYNTDFTDAFSYLLGRCIAQYLKVKAKPRNSNGKYVFAVGRDARKSGESLSDGFSNGLMDSGIDVIDLGIVPTPIVYFSTFNLNIDGAVSITGSHNPAEYNGFKLCLGTSTMHGSQIQELLKIAKELQSTNQKSELIVGKKSSHNIIPDYQKDIVSRVKLDKKIKVVLDAGNGAAAHVAPKLVEALGCEVIPLFCELDGSFPNHHPDPTVLENIKELQETVVKSKSHLGIAYDGDADRIGVVDENGKAIFGDELLVLYAQEILARKPGATIISEVKSSNRLFNEIARLGGKPIMWKTGHSLIKVKMKEENAALAGEMSGHVFFSDRYYGFDDAIYATARLLEIISKTEKPISALLGNLPKAFSTPEIRVDCDDEIKFKLVEEAKKTLSKSFKVIDIDGVRIETPDGWGLLRASNTQPVIVMRFEATSESRLAEIQKTVETVFSETLKKIQN